MSAWDAEVGVHHFCSNNFSVLTPCYITVLRDVRERGRDIEGIIKQWFAFVKPSFTRFVEPQRPISGRYLQALVLIVRKRSNFVA
jgi:hypothetical protein